MIVRIFLPESIHTLKSINNSKCYHIFGKIECDDSGENVSIFIVDVNEAIEQTTHSRQLIGNISQNIHDTTELPSDYIAFRVNDAKTVLELTTIHLPNFISMGKTIQTQLFLYDLKTFTELSHRIDEQKWCLRPDSISKLLILIKAKEINQIFFEQQYQSKQCIGSRRSRLFAFLLSLSLFAQIKLAFLNSAFLKHFQFWTANLEQMTQNSVHISTVLLDVIAGISVMLSLWHISNADEYLIQLAMFIVQGLQNLLDALKGSPVGLKLNVDLNNFFIECFRYHVDLWGTFLVIISPLVKYLFAPLAVIGCFGLSFQLSMLSDLLSVITLHSHCIYTYASIIYKIEINGLVGVWRVVSGRRKNILRGRIESYEYTNQQLYLSTICFSALLFLLPTILVYYIVFASLRFGIYCIIYSLTLARRKLLSLPVLYIIKWCLGQYASCDNFEVIHLDSAINSTCVALPVSVFLIKTVRSSFPSWIDVVVVKGT